MNRRQVQQFLLGNAVRRRRLAAVVTMSSISAIAYIVAYLVRFDLDPQAVDWRLVSRTTPIVIGLRVGAAVAYGLHAMLLVRVTRVEVWRTLRAVTVSSLVLLAAVVIARRTEFGYLGEMPLGVIVLDWGLAIGGLELLWLLLPAERHRPSDGARRVVIVGAGESGVSLALQMQRNPHYRLLPVAFVDDAEHKQRGTIAGVPVAGSSDHLPEIVREYGAESLIIATPSASPAQARRLIERCQRAGVPFRLLPSISELVDGRAEIARLREIDVADLLARPMAEIDYRAIRRLVTGQRIVVTGGGGSVGSELAKQIARLEPSALMLLDHAENPLFFTQAAIAREFPDLDLRAVIADVTDRHTMTRVLAEFRPRALLHAAAHKHVPLMEDVPAEAVRNNVGGTLVTAEAAVAAGVESFVLVSTDKAVHPSSVMGATKRLCELVVRDVARTATTRFIVVRFGNVLGSNGSVVPIFQQQIARGGPLTVTDERMERYFMALPEAAGLILQAGAVGESGQSFILDMGEPVRIVELAETIIRLHGLEPYRDVEIVFTGMRPGEKLTEELNYQSEAFQPTGYDKLLMVHEAEPEGVVAAARAFVESLPSLTADEVRTRLWAMLEPRDGDGRGVDTDRPIPFRTRGEAG